MNSNDATSLDATDPEVEEESRSSVSVTIELDVHDPTAFRRVAYNRALEDGLEEEQAKEYLDPLQVANTPSGRATRVTGSAAAHPTKRSISLLRKWQRRRSPILSSISSNQEGRHGHRQLGYPREGQQARHMRDVRQARGRKAEHREIRSGADP